MSTDRCPLCGCGEPLTIGRINEPGLSKCARCSAWTNWAICLAPSEFEEAIENLIDELRGDPEALHSEIDKALWKQLRALGYGFAIDRIEADDVTLWYA